jgi:hypothetical protein
VLESFQKEVNLMDADAKKRIALKEELLRDLEALERVERLMATRNGIPLPPDDRQSILPLSVSVSDSINVDDDPPEGLPTSLRGTMESILKAGGPSEKWTNQRMLNHLRAMKYPLRAKQPIYSIGQTMQKIEESGLIRISRKGAGNQPHIYRLKVVSEAGNEQPREENTANHAVI